MTKQKKIISVLTAAALLCTGIGTAGISQPLTASATDSIESSMDWDTLNIAGGGFVSGIITGDDQMSFSVPAMPAKPLKRSTLPI